MNPPTVDTRSVFFKDYREYYITVTKLGTGKSFLEELFYSLEKKNIHIVKVTFLGNSRIIRKWLSITGRKHPTLILGNSFKPASSLKNASICIHAVEGDFKESTYIKEGKEIVGAYFAGKNFESISLSGAGLLGSISGKDFKKEVQSIYKKIDTILSRLHFSPHSVYRFWNYFGDVYKNYAIFNTVRDQYYAKHIVTHFPAATGIEAEFPGIAQVQIGLEAIKPRHKKDVITKIVGSDMQSEAWSYGPKFSRAVLIEFPKDGVKKLYISGTSSIDREGKSVAQNNYGENVRYVVSSVEHLLKKNDMSLRNLLMSYVYCKNVDVQNAFEHLYANKKCTFPYNLVITNICRKDLVFEMECIAVNKVVIR